VSIIGKILPNFKKILKNIESQGGNNPLRNWAFCSTFTGSKSCVYVDGDGDQSVIIVHYPIDRFHDKPCYYPYLSCDIVALLDNTFVLKRPEGVLHYPYIVEVVHHKPKYPSKVTLDGLIELIAPSPDVSEADFSSALNPSAQISKPFRPIPNELKAPRSRYSLQEWCMIINEIYHINQNFSFHFVHGAESSIFRKKIRLFCVLEGY
jgi:hypothetical protein